MVDDVDAETDKVTQVQGQLEYAIDLGREAKGFEDKILGAVRKQITPQIKKLLVGHAKVFPSTGPDLRTHVERLETGSKESGTQRDAARPFDLGFGDGGRNDEPHIPRCRYVRRGKQT